MGRSITLARLTMETALSRRAIDEELLGLLELPNAANYRRFLCLLYGFQAPLEAALVQTPDLDLHFSRFRAGFIATDLLSLGLTRNDFNILARRQPIVPFETIAQALGWMYSTERLMLHVEAARLRLAYEMPVVFALAQQFLRAYENTAEIRWRQFGVMLDRVARTHSVEAIVTAARDGIASLAQWLATNTVAADEVRASA